MAQGLREAADVVDQLPQLLARTRARLRLTYKDVGARAGVSHTTVHRVETGQGCNSRTVASLLRWLAAA